LLGAQSSAVQTTDLDLGLALHFMQNMAFQQIMSPLQKGRISSQILTQCDPRLLSTIYLKENKFLKYKFFSQYDWPRNACKEVIIRPFL